MTGSYVRFGAQIIQNMKNDQWPWSKVLPWEEPARGSCNILARIGRIDGLGLSAWLGSGAWLCRGAWLLQGAWLCRSAWHWKGVFESSPDNSSSDKISSLGLPFRSFRLQSRRKKSTLLYSSKCITMFLRSQSLIDLLHSLELAGPTEIWHNENQQHIWHCKVGSSHYSPPSSSRDESVQPAVNSRV